MVLVDVRGEPVLAVGYSTEIDRLAGQGRVVRVVPPRRQAHADDRVVLVSAGVARIDVVPRPACELVRVVVEAEADLGVDELPRFVDRPTIAAEGLKPDGRHPLDVPVVMPIAAPGQLLRHGNALGAPFRMENELLDAPLLPDPSFRAQQKVALADVHDDRAEPQAPLAVEVLGDDVELRLGHEVRQDRCSDGRAVVHRRRVGAAASRNEQQTENDCNETWPRRGVPLRPPEPWSSDPLRQGARPSSTHALCPPRPIAFESATSTCTCRASFGT